MQQFYIDCQQLLHELKAIFPIATYYFQPGREVGIIHTMRLVKRPHAFKTYVIQVYEVQGYAVKLEISCDDGVKHSLDLDLDVEDVINDEVRTKIMDYIIILLSKKLTQYQVIPFDVK